LNVIDWGDLVKSSQLALWAVIASVGLGGTASAAPVTVASLSAPLVVGSSSNLATTGTKADSWTIAESFTTAGPSVLQFSDKDGVPLANGVDGFSSGSWVTATVTNNSGSDWTSFEFELQKTLGTTSNEMDGLSFAQRSNLAFTSSAFQNVSRIDTLRDYLNFSGGTVKSGSTVTFSFAITDMTPFSNPFYLVQTANKNLVINAAAAVPEPGMLTLFGTGVIGLLARRRRS
jgi:PEP-CTERM motif